jgi:hypothetical protein
MWVISLRVTDGDDVSGNNGACAFVIDHDIIDACINKIVGCLRSYAIIYK